MFEARLYDVLFKTSSVADTGDDWLEDLNPASLTTKTGAVSTPRVTEAAPGTRWAAQPDAAGDHVFQFPEVQHKRGR